MKTLLETFKLLKGMPMAKTIIVKSEADLEKIPFPYYMKASIAEHKLEKKAVSRIENLEEAKKFYLHLQKHFQKMPVVIQEQIAGIEMFIGLKQDNVFNKLISIGFGGSNIEVIKDIEFRALPVSRDEISKALLELRLYETLHKRRSYAIEKFIDLAYKVSKLNLRELDLNPVILTEDNAYIVDARMS